MLTFIIILRIADIMAAAQRWFHPYITGYAAEELLMKQGHDGSYLVRPSQSTPGDFTLSTRRGEEITHIKIQNRGEYYDLYGGEKFASLAELIQHYIEHPGQLKEKDGHFIELAQPLKSKEVTTERWYHGGISGQEAEAVLMEKGQNGNFLVRESAHSPGNYVITARVNDRVVHLKIESRMGKFDLGGGKAFDTLQELVDYYKQYPMVESTGTVIYLNSPLKSSKIVVSTIEERIAMLSKTYKDTYGKSGFWEEFEQIQQQEGRHLYNRKEGARPENKVKNRWKNILPYDHSRVVLKDVSSKMVGCDYINANYVDGEAEHSDKQYIATQGCLPGTVNDFWHMIHQENTKIIIMTTNEVERGRSKCTCYWPEQGRTQVYGSMIVHNSSESVNPHYKLREFIVYHEKDPNKTKIFHYHFTSWPDYGVPQEPGSVLAFLHDTNQKYRELVQSSIVPGPIVVHCSAGIGRTGTFIVIDILLNLISQNGFESEIDIQRTVQMLRSQRSGMVQTEAQYKFIYLAIVDFVKTQRALQTISANYTNMTFKPRHPSSSVIHTSAPSLPPKSYKQQTNGNNGTTNPLVGPLGNYDHLSEAPPLPSRK